MNDSGNLPSDIDNYQDDPKSPYYVDKGTKCKKCNYLFTEDYMATRMTEYCVSCAKQIVLEEIKSEADDLLQGLSTLLENSLYSGDDNLLFTQLHLSVIKAVIKSLNVDYIKIKV